MRNELIGNLRGGLRCALFMRAPVVATWGQLALLLALSVVSLVFWQWVAAGFAPRFVPFELPGGLFPLILSLFASCAIAALARSPAQALGLLVVLLAAGLWLDAFVTLARLAADQVRGGWLPWLAAWSGTLWLVACVACVRTDAFVLDWPRRAAAAAIAVAVVGVPMVFAGGHGALFTAAPAARSPDTPDHERARREEVLYVQPELLASALAALEPRSPGRPNLYLVGVAGYGHQNVFKREVDAVDALFAERFGTRGRSVRLVNNPASILDTPIATRLSLRRTLKHVGTLMDEQDDILFLFLTSHGAKEGSFEMELWPFNLDPLTPADLRQMLDDAGIRNRVIVVSSCYSGTFVEALRDDHTLVITASAADRNSFGCSNEADFTFFGKAYFDLALRSTDSFTEAFDRALPLVAQREQQDGYTPSNPQRVAGPRIGEVLEKWRREREPALNPPK